MDWKVIYVRIKDEAGKNETFIAPKDKQGRLLAEEYDNGRTSKDSETAEANETNGIIQVDQFRIKLDFTIPQLVSRNVKDRIFIRLFDEMYREEKDGLNVTFVTENLEKFTFNEPIP